MKKEEFIEKVKRQNYKIDFVDALILTHLFTQEFGVKITKLSMEDELCYMFASIIGENVKPYHFEESKICRQCKKLLPAVKFYRWGRVRKHICRYCEPRKLKRDLER